jgi:hypothetical protein
MSTIDSTTAAYQTFQKQYDDYQTETDDEKKKTDKQNNERTSAMEKKNAENLRRQADNSDRTVNNVKENANEALSQSRENDRRDLDQFKRESYDRFGRTSDAQTRENKKQVADLQNSLELREKQNNELLTGADKRHEQLSELMDRNTRQMSDRALDQQRNNLNESHEQAMRGARDSYQQLKAEGDNKMAALDRDRQTTISDNRREADRTLETQGSDYNRRLEQARQAYERNTARQETTMNNTKTDGTMKLRESHANETRQLRDQIRDLVSEEGTYMKEKGQGTVDATKEFDQKWRDRLNMANNSFTSEIEDMRANNKVQEHALDREMNEALRDKDRFYANSMRAQNADNHHALTDTQKMFEKNRQEILTSAKKDQENSQKSHDMQLTNQSEKYQETLTGQAKAFQETEKQHSEASNMDISRLQKALQTKQTSANPADMSPAAEATLRKELNEEYGKVQAADHESNQQRTDTLQRNYQDKFMDSEDQRKAFETKTQRQIASENHQSQNEFLNHITDTESAKELTLRNQQQQHDRETELLNHNYSRLLDHKGREQDEMLNVTRDDASNRINSIRQEAEFNSKMAQRSFSIRQNELIRDYEKKLADQKIDTDGRLEDAKNLGQANVRDTERKLKAQLDEALKANEQRLAQQDAQFKERERYLSQNYEDQLEKVKRSNALLIQKKS